MNNNIWESLQSHTSILILGFGREGQSTYAFIRKHDKERVLHIADIKDDIKNNSLLQNDKNLSYITGESYLDNLSNYDCIIKTPGISLSDELLEKLKGKLTSQADLFIKFYRMQIIGVTGTKGKSTTASFIFHAFKNASEPVILFGNIGIPPFDMINEIKPETRLIYELSSHMLQGVSASPHIAVFLNLFEEHLDYYQNMDRYAKAKAGIFKFQTSEDVLIVGKSDSINELVGKYGTKAHIITPSSLPEDSYPYTPVNSPIKNNLTKVAIFGQHVLNNLVLGATAYCYAGGNSEVLLSALESFKGLPHRLENVGTWKGITFIDDSISTIPEATLEALNTFPNSDILIVGGMDRGVSYDSLMKELIKKPDLYVFCIDITGRKIYDYLVAQNNDKNKYFYFEEMSQVIEKCYEVLSPRGGLVLLSPGAASFTQFKNFEERGKAFAMLAQTYGTK